MRKWGCWFTPLVSPQLPGRLSLLTASLHLPVNRGGSPQTRAGSSTSHDLMPEATEPSRSTDVTVTRSQVPVAALMHSTRSLRPLFPYSFPHLWSGSLTQPWRLAAFSRVSSRAAAWVVLHRERVPRSLPLNVRRRVQVAFVTDLSGRLTPGLLAKRRLRPSARIARRVRLSPSPLDDVPSSSICEQ